MNADEPLNTARRHQAAGAPAEAEKIYRQFLQSNPNHPEALYLLGALVSQRGETESAIDLIRQSIAAAPNHADAHRNLGLLLAKQGRLDESLDSFSRAVQLNPNDYQALRNAAKVLALQDKLDDALSAYRRVIQLKPDFAEAQLEFAYILSLQSRFQNALAAYSTALKIKPNLAAAHLGLGHIYRTMNLFDKALDSFRQAARLDPNLAEAHAGTAMVLAMTQKFNEALSAHARTVQLRPGSAIAHEVMGWIQLYKGDGSDAIDSFRSALAADPNLQSAWNSLGQALLHQGQFEEAADCFRRILALHPKDVVARKHLLEASRKLGSKQIQPLLDLIDQPNLSEDDRIVAEFALASAFDEAERYDEAFAHASSANALTKAQRAIFGQRYDHSAFRARVDQLIELFTPEFFARRRGWGDPSERPVFIVGMPRSGTTLVQQIAASHPDAFGAGELNNIASLAAQFPVSDASQWKVDAIRSAAAQHLAFLRSLNPQAARVLDKLPANLHRLGLIAVLFPNARILFCRRDARDTCLSCFFHSFPVGNNFSSDLADCGSYQRENDRLADHWLRVLPLQMLEVRYEELASNLEPQSRRLIDFLGLPWHAACLEFHRAKNTVLTLSAWQVRQPIYQKSIGRWRHYQQHLGLLFKALGE